MNLQESMKVLPLWIKRQKTNKTKTKTQRRMSRLKNTGSVSWQNSRETRKAFKSGVRKKYKGAQRKGTAKTKTQQQQKQNHNQTLKIEIIEWTCQNQRAKLIVMCDTPLSQHLRGSGVQGYSQLHRVQNQPELQMTVSNKTNNRIRGKGLRDSTTGKGTSYQDWPPELNPQTPGGKGREPIPSGCFLTSKYTL